MPRQLARFERLFRDYEYILTEGSVIERIRRESPELELDPNVLNAGLIYTEKGKRELTRIHRGYMDAGHEYNLPLILFAPTWRANRSRLQAAGLPPVNAYSRDAVAFMQSLRKQEGDYAEKMLIGGLMGPKGDAYNPRTGLPSDEAAEFHEEQVKALAMAGVDFLMAATLPSMEEALGMAQAMALSSKPYIISFVLRPSGTLLDGAPLLRAIETIDNSVHRRPYAYWANCVHPRSLGMALQQAPLIIQPGQLPEDVPKHLLYRLHGLQANASDAPPETLDNAESLQADDPSTFAEAMLKLAKDHRWFKVLGGCCGTDNRHIRKLAEGIKRL